MARKEAAEWFNVTPPKAAPNVIALKTASHA
jgi:hypothetical protein